MDCYYYLKTFNFAKNVVLVVMIFNVFHVKSQQVRDVSTLDFFQSS